MSPSIPILASVRAQYPKSANRLIMVQSAWRPEDSTLARPAANGSDGWTPVNLPATDGVVRGLLSQGFTWVNLSAGGVAQRYRDTPISDLL